MEISLVGASILPPSDSVVAFQAKVSRFQRVRAAKPLRAKLELLDLFLSGIALGSPKFAQKSLRGTCAAVAIQPSLLKSIGVQGKGRHNIQMRWKSRSARVDRASSRSRILGTYGFEEIQFCYDVDMNTLSSVIEIGWSP